MSQTSTSEKLKHPTGLYFCGSIFSVVNFSYYGMKLVLVLFLAESMTRGGLGLSAAESASMLASFMAWAYLSPVVGGWISDRWLGPKNSVALGVLIVAIGYFIGFIATTKFTVNLMIVLVVIGAGFYKGNLQTLVGELYENDDPRKDGAFSITYTFTNIGVLFGPFLCGLIANEWLAQKNGGEILVYGYKYVFLTVAIISFLGYLFFIFGQKNS